MNEILSGIANIANIKVMTIIISQKILTGESGKMISVLLCK